MIRHTVPLFLISLVSACGGGQRRSPNDEVTTRMTASDEAALGARAEPVADVAAAVDRCLVALENAAADSAAADARAAAVACAELFDRPGCRAAHRRAADLPIDRFVVTIFEECAREYCPLFDSGQRPAACDASIGGDASHAAAAWLELRASIWDLELEPDQRERLEAGQRPRAGSR